MAESGLSQEKLKLIDRIASFVQRHRKVFWVSLFGVVVGLIGVLGYVEFQKMVIAESTQRIEAVLEKVQNYQLADDQEKVKQGEQINTELTAIISAYPNHYAGIRALHVKAELAFENKDYKGAAELWDRLANKHPRSHLAPVALMRAAVSREELGDTEGAIQALRMIDEKYRRTFPEISRVLFSLGRILETKNAYNEAAVYYNRLIDEYPNSSWTNLGRNRLIHFQTAQLVTNR